MAAPTEVVARQRGYFIRGTAAILGEGMPRVPIYMFDFNRSVILNPAKFNQSEIRLFDDELLLGAFTQTEAILLHALVQAIAIFGVPEVMSVNFPMVGVVRPGGAYGRRGIIKVMPSEFGTHAGVRVGIVYMGGTALIRAAESSPEWNDSAAK